MASKNIIDAVIFDMDGVLIDSEPYYISRFERLFTACGKTFTEEIRQKLAGISTQAEFELIKEYWDDDITVDKLRSIFLEVNKDNLPDYHQLMFPDTIETLEIVKKAGLQVALASSSGKLTINKVLSQLDMEKYFGFVISGEMFEQSKPHPEIYLHTLQKLDVEADKCIAVEDSTYGITSAAAAGLRVAAIRDHRFGYDQSAAAWLIDSLSELPSILGI